MTNHPETNSTPDEPQRAVDPRDNAEVRAVQEGGSRQTARAADSGPVPSPARDPQDPLGIADDVAAGTGQGDPTAGVQIDPEDAAQAVPADDGPTGTR